MATIFKETTKVPVARSLGEIVAFLRKAGAMSVTQTFDESGGVISLRFSLPLAGQMVWFSLPCRANAVYAMLKKGQGRSRTSDADLKAQADRIAWRHLHAWTQAQLALIETGLVETEEVFMPYRWDEKHQTTLFEYYKSSQILLTAGGKK